MYSKCLKCFPKEKLVIVITFNEFYVKKNKFNQKKIRFNI